MTTSLNNVPTTTLWLSSVASWMEEKVPPSSNILRRCQVLSSLKNVSMFKAECSVNLGFIDSFAISIAFMVRFMDDFSHVADVLSLPLINSFSVTPQAFSSSNQKCLWSTIPLSPPYKYILTTVLVICCSQRCLCYKCK